MQSNKLILKLLLSSFLCTSIGATILIRPASAAIDMNLNSAANYQVLSGAATTIGASVVGLNLSEVGVSTSATADLLSAMATAHSLTSVGVAADLGGQTYVKGAYYSAAAMTMTSNITLDAQGDPTSIFVFITPAAMNTTAGISMKLANGANPCNIYWVAGGAVTVGASGKILGNFLSAAAITVGASTEVSGRLLAGAAVTVGASVIFKDFSVSSCNGPVGGLSITVPDNLNLGNIDAGDSVVSKISAIKVTDTRSGSGSLSWSVSIESSSMKNSANDEILTDKISYEVDSPLATSGLHLLSYNFNSLLNNSNSPLVILTADNGSNPNGATWNALVTIHVPFDQPQGIYTGSIIHSVY